MSRIRPQIIIYFISGLALTTVIAAVVSGYTGILYTKMFSERIVVLERQLQEKFLPVNSIQPIAQETEATNPDIKNLSVQRKIDSTHTLGYEPNRTVYLYTDGYGGRKVLEQNVFISNNGDKPTFFSTSDPTVTVLTTSDGDVCGWYQTDYYISTKNNLPEVTKIHLVHPCAETRLNITTPEQKTFTIEYGYENPCATTNAQGIVSCRADGETTINTITVNGKNMFPVTTRLQCGGNGDFDNTCKIYPTASLAVRGISPNLKQIYFTLTVAPAEPGQPAWHENFVFNLEDESVKRATGEEKTITVKK